jgi:3-hydroxyacyl-[acyl-carrier-protein] dehydratase
MENFETGSMYRQLKQCCTVIEVVERSETTAEIRAEFQFHADFAGFKGHFPDHPVLPAVCQFLAVRIAVEGGLGGKLVTLGCRRTKFTGVVCPGDLLTASLSLKYTAGSWRCSFTLATRDGAGISSGEMTFRE